ncbi:hypothetical protein EVAR_37537_1 [Eumeta japonica]|uniref:Uncharacterized protein n=1 Tax=Eumeta variegata TaxID=151549 RepID=A0A4C1XVA1_EUMVA|nr:hypothetical protein EVAR_37537_1 [Eumeta japonica]
MLKYIPLQVALTKNRTASRVEHSKRATSGSLLAGFPVTRRTECTNARGVTRHITPRNAGQYPPLDRETRTNDNVQKKRNKLTLDLLITTYRLFEQYNRRWNEK